MYDRLFCPHQHSEMYGYSKLYLDQMFERNMRPLKDTNACMSVERGVCVLGGGGGTFCCKFWVYSLRVTLFQCLAIQWWCSWPKMAYKMSQEFPNASLDITELTSKHCRISNPSSELALVVLPRTIDIFTTDTTANCNFRSFWISRLVTSIAYHLKHQHVIIIISDYGS